MGKKEIFVGIAAFLFVLGALTYGLSTRDPDRSDWVLSVGRIYAKSEVRSKWRGVQYLVNGTMHRGVAGIGLDGNIVGDVYQILVNPNNYDEVFLLEERPVF